jgi:predicted unusual protein kinase regulating ubiquinone biosynthesis (AarF/ABC1/UbiB family)
MPYYEMGNLVSYKWSDINQLCSVLKQTVLNIISANQKIGFIHGDLHPGNIVLENTDDNVYIYNLEDLGFYVIPTFGIKGLIMDFEESDLEKKNSSSFDEAIYIQKIDSDFEKLFTNLKGYFNIDILTLAPINIYINTHIMKCRRLNKTDIEKLLNLIDNIKFI